MKKIVAFGATTSSKSINKKFAKFAGSQLQQLSFDLIDLNDYEMPMYSIDEELENGFSSNTIRFFNLFKEYDGFIISLAEHNGSYTAAFKNMFDWASRIEMKLFRNKPILLLATSPGKRGGLTVLEQATATFPRHGASQVFSFSLPSFSVNFKEEKIENKELLEVFQLKIKEFETFVNQ